MSAAEKIPWSELPMTADDCAKLWAVSADHWLRTIACQPGFPVRVTRKPATWLAGEVVAWRNANRYGDRFGHRDPRSLMHYYSADPDELADRL